MVVGMERLSRELRDRQVRIRSVSTDLELGLPPNIALPDGEEVPYGSSTRLQIRDPEQVYNFITLLLRFLIITTFKFVKIQQLSVLLFSISNE